MCTSRRSFAFFAAFTLTLAACTSESPAAETRSSPDTAIDSTSPDDTAPAETAAPPTSPKDTSSAETSPATSVPPDASEATNPDIELIRDGLVTDDALAALAVDGGVDETAAAALIAEINDLPEAEWTRVFADLSRRYELQAAQISGLDDAIGDAARAADAIDNAWAAVAAQVASIDTDVQLEPVPKPSGFTDRQSTAAPPSATTVAVTGIALAATGLASVVDVAVSASNGLTSADTYSEQRSAGALITGAVEQSTVELDYDGKQDDVAVKFHAEAVSHPCPAADGSFDSTAKIDISTSKGKAGHKQTIDLTIHGQVDDDAKLASSQTETRTQAADFGGAAAGQFLDFTHGSSSNAASTFTFNRSGGTITTEMISLSVLLNALVAHLIGDELLATAEKAWSSGRCVRLDATPSAGPSGLTPSAEVSVLAAPRSRIDGGSTGGSVTATLTAGEASVSPTGTKVPADATFTYVAPGEKDKTGTVAFEARSKRGVGRASIDFDTKMANAYVIVGGLQDWQVNQAVCNILEPFTLSSEIGTMQLSGGLEGTYEFTGAFNSSYTGEYVITLPNGAGQPGTMVGGGSGTIAGQGGSGTEQYTLTPTTC